MEGKERITVQIFCPDCGIATTGYRMENGEQRFRCAKCRMMLIRSYDSRRHSTIAMIAPRKSDFRQESKADSSPEKK